MKKYLVLETITINDGLLGLTDEQASARAHLIEPAGKKKNVYRVIQPVCFKAGEVIGLDDIDKDHFPKLEDLEAKAEAEAKAKADAEAKAKAEAEAKAKADAGK